MKYGSTASGRLCWAATKTNVEANRPVQKFGRWMSVKEGRFRRAKSALCGFCFFTATVIQTSASAQPDAPSLTMPPTSGAIEAVLPVSDQITAIVVDPVEAVIQYIDDRSGGRYKPAIAEWERTKDSSSPSWKSRKLVESLHKTYVYAARTDIELEIMQTAAWQVNGARPDTMTTVPVGVDQGRTIGAGNIDWRWVVYLVRSAREAASAGGQWDVRLSTRYLSGTAQWEQGASISRALRVNQVGYLRDGGKLAYYGVYMWGLPQSLTIPSTASGSALPFDIKDAASNATVWRGTGATVKSDPRINRRMHGEEPLWQLDFSDWRPRGDGWYYIDVPGVGRSWPFRVGNGSYVFGEAFYTAARGLYHQRCGQALSPQLTAWPRGTDPAHALVYETGHIRSGYGPDGVMKPESWNAIRFDIVGGTIDTSRATRNVIGDWHDAADFDRSVQHFKAVYDLLYAFELSPQRFNDQQLNIPESGNGIPDILDEAVWGMLPWISSMDRRGGVSGMIEARSHFKFLDPKAEYGFARRERWSTLALCAAAAQAARLIETHGGNWGGEAASISQYLRSVAIAAWDYGSNSANDLGTVKVLARKDRGLGSYYTATYTQTPDQINMYMIHAASQMYLLLGQKSLLSGIDKLIGDTREPGRYPYSFKDHHGWTAFHIARGDVPSDLQSFVRNRWYARPANALVALLEGNGYQVTWRAGGGALGWGNGSMLNEAEFLLAAYALLGKESYREAALRNVEHAFGANPMGMSWTTGIGWTYPVVLQHSFSVYDDVADPVPGITIYGPTGGDFYPELKRDIWSVKDVRTGNETALWTPKGDAPLWRTWSPHPHLYVPANEFTVHQTMGSPVFVLSQLLDSAWTPTAELRNRGPRPDDELYGRVFLP